MRGQLFSVELKASGRLGERVQRLELAIAEAVWVPCGRVCRHLGEVFQRPTEPGRSRIDKGHLQANHVHKTLPSQANAGQFHSSDLTSVKHALVMGQDSDTAVVPCSRIGPVLNGSDHGALPVDAAVERGTIAATPPKRRSLRQNSVSAPSRSAASKSGHMQSVNRSSA